MNMIVIEQTQPLQRSQLMRMNCITLASNFSLTSPNKIIQIQSLLYTSNQEKPIDYYAKNKTNRTKVQRLRLTEADMSKCWSSSAERAM